MEKKSNLTISDFEIDDEGVRFSVVESVQFRGHEWRAWFNFPEVLDLLFVRIMMAFDASDEITEATGRLLKQLTRDDVYTVVAFAENFDDRVLNSADPERIPGVDCFDTAETIEKYRAVLAALIPWLKSHAINEGQAYDDLLKVPSPEEVGAVAHAGRTH
jgi:hypothetical protein